MRSQITACLLIFVMSSCSTSYYINKSGVVDTPKKDTYTVTYQINPNNSSPLQINYTAEDGKTVRIKNATGDWQQTVNVKSGTRLKMKVKSSSPLENATFKVLVEEKPVLERKLSAKKFKLVEVLYLP